MKIIVTEETLSRLIHNIVTEQYSPNNLYPRDNVMTKIWRRDKKTNKFVAPKYIRDAAKNIQTVKKINDQGKEISFVKIPEAIYVYIYGKL